MRPGRCRRVRARPGLLLRRGGQPGTGPAGAADPGRAAAAGLASPRAADPVDHPGGGMSAAGGISTGPARPHRALVYGDIDLNLIDGSAVWVQSTVQALARAGCAVTLA